jgi:hypothetical protein
MGYRLVGLDRHEAFLYSVQTGFGAHPTSCPEDTGDFLPGIKRPENEAGHSFSSSGGVKNGEAVPLVSRKSS